MKYKLEAILFSFVLIASFLYLYLYYDFWLSIVFYWIVIVIFLVLILYSLMSWLEERSNWVRLSLFVFFVIYAITFALFIGRIYRSFVAPKLIETFYCKQSVAEDTRDNSKKVLGSVLVFYNDGGESPDNMLYFDISRCASVICSERVYKCAPR